MVTLHRSTEDDSQLSPHEQRSLPPRTHRELQFLRDLSDAEIERLAASSRFHHVERHQVVYCAGERLSEALGQLLLEQRRSLPDSGDFRAAEKRRQQLVVETSLRQIRNQQERARLRDINLYIDELTASVSDTWKKLLRVEVLNLAEARRDLIDKAIAAEDTYAGPW